MCMAWVGHNRLEPEIPCNSVAIIEPTHNFVIDGVYALNLGGSLELYRCSGLSCIAMSDNDSSSLNALDGQEFTSLVVGKVVGSMKFGI